MPDIPTYRSSQLGPESSGLPLGDPNIVGGTAPIHGAANLAGAVLQLGRAQEADTLRLLQAEQITAAGKALAEMGSKADLTWDMLKQEQLDNPINPRVMHDIYTKTLDDKAQELGGALQGSWAQQYFQTHLPTVLHSRRETARKETFAMSVAHQKGAFDDTLQQFAEGVAHDPDNESQYTKQAKAYIQGQSWAIPGLDPSTEWNKWKGAVNFRTANDAIQQDPGAFLAARGKGTYPTGGKWNAIHWDEVGKEDYLTLHSMAEKVSEANRKGWEQQLDQARDTTRKQVADKMWGGIDPESGKLIPGQDAHADIQRSRELLTAPEYTKLLEDNHQIINAGKAEVTAGLAKQSDFTRTRLLDLAERAAFKPELLNSLINEDVIKHHVFKQGDLLPDDATMVYAAVKAARLHQESGDSSTRRAEQVAMRSLQVYIPPTSDPKDATNLHLIQEDKERQFVSELRKNPDANATQLQEMANTINAHGELRVIAAQQRSIADLDTDMFGMEQLWQQLAPGVAGSNHKLDPKQRKQMEELFPLLKGAFQLHDVRRQRWENMTNVNAEQAGKSGAKRGR